MIVKNEEKMLAKTLPNLSKHADEIILVDTGSTDGTVKVALKFDAKVFHFTWVNNFSAARNESLKYASGDWILWIDADEFMKEDDLKLLLEILKTTKANALELTLYESKLDSCERNNGYQRTKVFRNGLGYHFERPINEQLMDKGSNVVVGKEIPIHIYHWGRHLEKERMSLKRERYIDLYSQALKANPADAHLHFLLAKNLKESGRLNEAVLHYEKAFSSAPDKKIGREALEKMADILLRAKKLPEAAKVADRIIKLDPENIPARNIFASIFLVLGKVDMAIEVLTEVLNIKSAGEIENLYQSRVMPNFLLGQAYQLKGESEKAQACFARVREISPELVGAN
jgi:glycosyltransferase involved in cell wall biosynthesis